MADINIHAPGYVKDNSAKGLCSVYVDDRGVHVVDAKGEKLCTLDSWRQYGRRDLQIELALRFAAADQMQKALEKIRMAVVRYEDDDALDAAKAAADAALALAKGETLSMAELAVPTIHLNGTSREELLRQQLDVLQAFDKLYEAMAKASPNGRDHYVRGPDAFGDALLQHRSRMVALKAVESEVRAIAEAISGRSTTARNSP